MEEEIKNVKDEFFKKEISKDIINDEQCNHKINVEKSEETNEILKSIIDPDAGILYKDEKEKMVAYNTTTINKDGYIIYKAANIDCEKCPFKSQCTKNESQASNTSCLGKIHRNCN